MRYWKVSMNNKLQTMSYILIRLSNNKQNK